MKKTTCTIALLFAAIVAYGQSNHYLTKEEAPHDTVFIGPPPAFGSLLFEQDFHMNSSPIKLGQNRPKQTLNQIV